MTNEYGFEIPLVSEEECKLQERIEELEQEKCELLGIIQGKDKVIKDLEWQLQEVAKDNDIYQKENETLKKQLDALSGDVPWSKLKDVSEVTKKLTEENAELKARLQKKINTTTVSDYPYSALKLEEAKELLNEFMRISKASDEDFEHDYSELIRETEQFIKEIENDKHKN